MIYSKSVRLVGVFAIGILSGTARAQLATNANSGDASQGLQEIVVTATKTGATEAQKTPIALSVYSSDQLNNSVANNVKDLVALTPSLNVSQTTASAEIYIRGIGSNNVFNGSDPDVTVQSDGVYIARAFGQFADFLDVSRVEVLRGPQGTLYGRNAVGGTINIISRAPTDDFEAKTQVTLGDYSLLQTQAYVSGALVKGLLDASLSVNYITHSPWEDNIVPGQPGLDDANHGGLRGQLLFRPTDNVQMTTRMDWSKADEYFDASAHLLAPYPKAPLATSILGNYTLTALDTPQLNHEEIWGISEDINAQINDWLSLKSITAYRDSWYRLTVDGDGTELPINSGYQADLSKQFSQELNLVAKRDHFDGVAGVYFFNEHEISEVYSDLPAPGPNLQNLVQPDAYARSYAAFAQGTYHLFDTVGLTAGARYTEDRKELNQYYSRNILSLGVPLPGYPFIDDVVRHFHATTPKFGVDWQATPDVLVYATATRGFKSGGTNYAASNAAALSFAPEYIWSYETGAKSEWLDHRLRVNLTGFLYDYSNLQVQSLLGPGVTTIANAATAKIKGAELETTVEPIPRLVLTANYSLLNARYTRFDAASVPASLTPYLAGSPNLNPNGTYDASGNRLSAAPHDSVSTSAQYGWNMSGGRPFLRAEYYWQSRAYYDPSNAPIMSQKAYGLANAFVGYDSDSKWSVHFFVKNLTDTHYLIFIAAITVVPSGVAAAPRTYGVQLTKSF
jgi:iron complex outermembrane recepter protein